MRYRLAACTLLCAIFLATFHAFAEKPKFKIVAFYSADVEADHVKFAKDAIQYFTALAVKDNFEFQSTSDWSNLNAAYLKPYQLVLWFDDSPHKKGQRLAFQQYMESGGAWMGFHFGGYNDSTTNWPWFVNFLGGAVFLGNSWPLLPATLKVDKGSHPVTEGIPETFVSPPNEWYVWKPDPRSNKNVRVLVTLDPSNYPLGIHDIILSGDVPVVWTNTNYKMIYMNMGHGDKIFSSPIQNRLIDNAVLWLGRSRENTHAPQKNIAASISN